MKPYPCPQIQKGLLIKRHPRLGFFKKEENIAKHEWAIFGMHTVFMAKPGLFLLQRWQRCGLAYIVPSATSVKATHFSHWCKIKNKQTNKQKKLQQWKFFSQSLHKLAFHILWHLWPFNHSGDFCAALTVMLLSGLVTGSAMKKGKTGWKGGGGKHVALCLKRKGLVPPGGGTTYGFKFEIWKTYCN